MATSVSTGTAAGWGRDGDVRRAAGWPALEALSLGSGLSATGTAPRPYTVPVDVVSGTAERWNSTVWPIPAGGFKGAAPLAAARPLAAPLKPEPVRGCGTGPSSGSGGTVSRETVCGSPRPYMS